MNKNVHTATFLAMLWKTNRNTGLIELFLKKLIECKLLVTLNLR